MCSKKNKEIETTEELVNIIIKSIPLSKQKEGHPAKRTFQAIRIEVNNEIKPLYKCILDCIDTLNEGGRLAVITFHSLEDRAVKMHLQRQREFANVQRIYHTVYAEQNRLAK